MIGICVVFIVSLAFARGGILLSLSGSLAGQTLSASVIDTFFRKKEERNSLLQRIISPGLLLPGSFIIGIKCGVPIPWILLSWVPGILLMIQQKINSQNTIRWGTPVTVLFNYISALVIIIPLFVITGIPEALQEAGTSLSGLNDLLPWYYWIVGGFIGVFSTAITALLLVKAPALVVILGIFSGELTGGILLDIYNGNPVVMEKVIGLVLIAAGLLSGKINLPGKAGKKEENPTPL